MTRRVAICIQVYNEGKFLAETIESVLNQSFEDFDLIVSDNHSKDATPDIIARYQGRDSRVVRWQPDEFCKSLEHARYVTRRVSELEHPATLFLGGHDVLDRDYLARLHTAFDANPQAAVVVGSGFEIDLEGKRLREWPSIAQLKGGLMPFRPLVVLMSLFYNIAAFGLTARRVRQGVAWRHECVGADHLWLAEAALLGDIVVEPAAVIHTRRTEGAGEHATYFKKHISDDLGIENIIANFERQLEWATHINDLAFAAFPESVRNINLAALLGNYFSRYGVAQLSAVDGALERWLGSEAGLRLASQMSASGQSLRGLLAGPTTR
jgi:Glycosyl transferase family 2